VALDHDALSTHRDIVEDIPQPLTDRRHGQTLAGHL
jgi:hypothetical protein